MRKTGKTGKAGKTGKKGKQDMPVKRRPLSSGVMKQLLPLHGNMHIVKKKRIDTHERDTTSGQSFSDFLTDAGLRISSAPEEDPTPSAKAIANKASKPKESLHIRIEKKGRSGKVVTIVSGFTGLTGVIEDLARVLKAQCGVGGSVVNREIVLQGDLHMKIAGLLQDQGYKVR
jgi:translation initiation factor 1